jgi:hypothetical protein
LQRNTLIVPISIPLKRPYFCIANKAYCEQLGVNLQEGGSSGETNLWYALIAAEAASLGHTLNVSTSGLSNRALHVQLADRGEELLLQLLEVGVGGRRTGRDHDVDAARQIGGCAAEDLAQPTPYSVTLHRYADLLGDGQAQPRPTHGVRQGVDGEKPSPAHRALAIDPLEFERGGEASALTSGQRSNSQPLAPPPAPRGDDPTPADRAHALAEPVGLGSLSTVRLISTLHATPR